MTKYHKLSDFFNAIIGGEWGQEPISTKAVSVLRTTNFRNDGTVDYTDIALRNISPSKIKEKALAYQDIIIEKSGGSDKQPVGRVVFFENESGKFLCNNFTQILRVDQTNYYPRYVFYYLYSLYLSGATLPYQNKTTGIRNLQLAAYLNLSVKHDIPNRIEQKWIAERLDKVQELIAKQKEQIAKLDLLIKSRFLDMFGDPISNPKHFFVDNLGKICDVRDGTHDSPRYVLEGYPLITSKNIINGTISFNDVNLIAKADFDAINKRSKVNRGDILLPMIGTIGNPALVIKEPNYAIKNMALIKFTPESKCSNLYILHLLRSSFLDSIVQNQQRGGTQKFLALKFIRVLRVPIPPANLQTQFANFVKSVEQQKEVFSSRLSHLETLYKSLMQEYFG